MVVEDATKGPRFAQNPLVVGAPGIRFYAGAPLVMPSRHALGTVCVIDTEPRQVTQAQVEELRFLAQQVVSVLEARKRRSRALCNETEPREMKHETRGCPHTHWRSRKKVEAESKPGS